MKPTSKKSLLFAIVSFFLVVSGILYFLADRYLIEHVEIADVNSYASTFTTDTTSETSSLDEDNTTVINPSSGGNSSVTTLTQENAVVTDVVFSDDWNYQSSEFSISISEVTTGNGNDKVTYFVADIILTDATQLSSAFAENSFGTNIIAYTSEIAADNNAIFAINGDYYGFRTDGIVIRNGVIYRDIPARIGLAFYRDGTMKIYDEMQTSAQQLLDDGVWNTFSFGPALIENSAVVDDFGRVEIDTNFGNHSIQGENPRTGVGIIDENHFIFVVVDGRSRGYSRGVTLEEFAQIFADLGCTDAYNLDGGGSSVMYFMGRLVNNPLGRNKERGTSDILYIGS